ncbi:MAG: hypothetical protein JWR74_3224 [Polaromonas sp.]|nr:hypothetical protein [Polaromonas sp.]
MNCCDSFGDCNQGRLCPVRKQPATHYCDKSRQPCVTPFQCLPGCKLTPAAALPPIDRKPRFTVRSAVAWGAVLLIFPPLAALCVRLAVRFSN